MRMDDVLDEPVFQASRAPSASDEAGVWGEPALSEVEAADAARTERRVWLREQWESTGTDPRLGVFAALCALSGLWAILCTFMKGAFGFGALAVVVGAPLVEEISKAMGPLMVLEKRPWLFGSASSIVLIGIASGLVFASVENLLYFFVYLPSSSLTPGLVLWRLTVCTLLHVTVATLSCFGLSRAWRHAAQVKGTFEMSSAVPWMVAAMIVHGLYNAAALVYGILT